MATHEGGEGRSPPQLYVPNVYYYKIDYLFIWRLQWQLSEFLSRALWLGPWSTVLDLAFYLLLVVQSIFAVRNCCSATNCFCTWTIHGLLFPPLWIWLVPFKSHSLSPHLVAMSSEHLITYWVKETLILPVLALLLNNFIGWPPEFQCYCHQMKLIISRFFNQYLMNYRLDSFKTGLNKLTAKEKSMNGNYCYV